LQAVHAYIRHHIPHIEQDRILYECMQDAIDIIQSGELPKLARATAAKEGVPYATSFTLLFDSF